jgi:uncharacterized protein YjiK
MMMRARNEAGGFRKTKKYERIKISKDMLLYVISEPMLFIKHFSQN